MTQVILNCHHCGVSMEVKKLYLTEPLLLGDEKYKGTMVTECANPECKIGAVLEF